MAHLSSIEHHTRNLKTNSSAFFKHTKKQKTKQNKNQPTLKVQTNKEQDILIPRVGAGKAIERNREGAMVAFSPCTHLWRGMPYISGHFTSANSDSPVRQIPPVSAAVYTT